MSSPDRLEQEIRALLAPLDEEQPEAGKQLVEQTMERVKAELSAHDMIDLTTSVFVLKFFAPMLDLILGSVGASLQKKKESPDE